MHKRGQISIFILLGILVLLFIGFFFFATQQQLLMREESPTVTITRTYMETCLEDQLREVIQLVAMQGGYFDEPLYALNYTEDGENYSLYEPYVPYYIFHGQNTVVSQAQIEEEISKGMVTKIDKCTDFSMLLYNVTADLTNIDVDSTLTQDTVETMVSLPLEIRTEDSISTIDKFSIEVDTNLYKLYETAVKMTEEQYKRKNTLCLTCLSDIIAKQQVQLEMIEIPSGSKVVLSTDGETIDIDASSSVASVKVGDTDFSMLNGEVLRGIIKNVQPPPKVSTTITTLDEEGEEDYLSTLNEDLKVNSYGIAAGRYLTYKMLSEPAANTFYLTDQVLVSTGMIEESPISAEFFAYYLTGGGYERVIDEKDVPEDWKEWVVKNTKGKEGEWKAVDPYNTGPYDLRNAFGHFDLKATKNQDGSITYEGTDVYAFPARKFQHGFKLSDLTTQEVADGINQILPDTTYTNKKGYKEKWEVKKLGGEYFLLFPQPLLEQSGTDFPSGFSFTVPAEEIAEYKKA